MPSTGARAAALSELLNRAGLAPTTKPPAPRLGDLAPSHAAEAVALYQQLGGMNPSPTLRPGSWDLAVTYAGDVLVIELDEELHFNRYREMSLDAPWYRNVSWARDYVAQCTRHERRCLDAGSWGKRWTTPSAEASFGPAGPTGQLAGFGAPRWRQRAFYDALKDLAAQSEACPPLARLSIYDIAGQQTLARILGSPRKADLEHVRAIIASRTGASSNPVPTSADPFRGSVG